MPFAFHQGVVWRRWCVTWRWRFWKKDWMCCGGTSEPCASLRAGFPCFLFFGRRRTGWNHTGYLFTMWKVIDIDSHCFAHWCWTGRDGDGRVNPMYRAPWTSAEGSLLHCRYCACLCSPSVIWDQETNPPPFFFFISVRNILSNESLFLSVAHKTLWHRH